MSTQQGPFVRFDFSANAFLHHMVRNIVGALVHVGAGKHAPAWLAELLAARDRARAAPTFAAEASISQAPHMTSSSGCRPRCGR